MPIPERSRSEPRAQQNGIAVSRPLVVRTQQALRILVVPIVDASGWRRPAGGGRRHGPAAGPWAGLTPLGQDAGCSGERCRCLTTVGQTDTGADLSVGVGPPLLVPARSGGDQARLQAGLAWVRRYWTAWSDLVLRWLPAPWRPVWWRPGWWHSPGCGEARPGTAKPAWSSSPRRPRRRSVAAEAGARLVFRPSLPLLRQVCRRPAGATGQTTRRRAGVRSTSSPAAREIVPRAAPP